MITISRSLQYMDGLKKETPTEFEILSVTSGTQENVITAGTGKGISFQNPYICQNQVTDIYNRIVGYEYLPCSVKWRGNPASESGDVVNVIDADNVSHKAFISKQSITMCGGFASEVKSVGKTDAEIQFDNVSPTEKKIKQAYTELQEAISRATELLGAGGKGIIKFTDGDGNGVNDGLIASETTGELTPTTKCLVLNHQGLGLSQDGGATYENAITHDGIVADSIKTGTLSAISINGCSFKQNNVGSTDYIIIKDGVIIGTDSSTEVNISPKIYITDNATAPQWGAYIASTAMGITNGDSTSHSSLFNNKLELYKNNIKIARLSAEGDYGSWLSLHNDSGTETITLSSNNPFGGCLSLKNSSGTQRFFATANPSANYALQFDGNQYVNGSVYATGGCSSRVEWKNNIKRYDDNATDIVKDAEIYSYKLNKDTQEGFDRICYGFVIGEDYNHTPTQCLSANGDGIDAYSMCAILWKAVQELTKKIENLEAEKMQESTS